MDILLGILFESSVRAAVIAASTILVLWGMRVKSPSIRHRAWMGVLVAMLFLPFISVWMPRIAIPVLPEDAGSQTSQIRNIAPEFAPVTNLEKVKPKTITISTPPSVQESMPVRSEKRSGSLFDAISTLYLIGFGILLVRLLMGMIISYRLLCKTGHNDIGFCCPQCIVPLTIGLLRPRILLPMESRKWDDCKLAAVLIHEREHVRRRDPLVEWLSVLNRCIYWFNPLAWWLCRKLSALAEQACDEAVLAQGHDCEEYAEFLLELSRSVKRKGVLVMALGSSIHGSTLSLRIRKILTAGLSPALSQTRLVLVVALCTIAAILPTFCKLAHAQKTSSPQSVASPVERKMFPPEFGINQNDQSESKKTSPESIPLKPSEDELLFKSGTEYLQKGQYPKARLAFQTLISTYSDDKLGAPSEDELLYKKGAEYVHKGQYIKARLAFQSLINSYPDSKLAPLSYIAIGDAFLNEGGPENLRQAEDTYKNFMAIFSHDPNAPYVEKELTVLGWYRDRGIYKASSETAEPDVYKHAKEQLQKGFQDYQDKMRPYRKWLNEDVCYLITEEERKTFSSLSDFAEMDLFIEQFWERNNPNPGSSTNTFKEEHYRRIAYANDHFASNIPGWRTDRGRIYILWGKPDDVEAHPTPQIQGGNTAWRFPFERWCYLRPQNGDMTDICLEFIDPDGNGNYRMAIHPDEMIEMIKPKKSK
jgi:GWxTD domain-containing protein